MREPTNNAVTTLGDYLDGGQPEGYNDVANAGYEADLPDDLALQTTLAELGDGGADHRVKIYQIDPRTNRDVYLYETSVQDFASPGGGMEEIQMRYGKGSYRVRVFKPGSRGNVTHRRLEIGEPIKKATETTTQNGVAEMMAAQTQMFLSGLKEISGQIATIAAASHQQSQGTSTNDVLAMISALAPIMGGGNNRGSDPLDLLSKIMDIQQKLSPPRTIDGEVGGGEVALEAIKSFGPVLAEMMQKNSQSRATQPAAVPRLPAPNGNATQITPQTAIANPIAETAQNQAAEIQTQQIQETEDDMSLKFRMIKPVLIMMAANDADVTPYVDMALDTFDDAEINRLIGAENWFDQLCVTMPEARPYQAWFSKLRDGILTVLQSEQNTDNVAGNPTPGSVQ